MALINPLLGGNLAASAFDTTLIGNSAWFDGSADYLEKTFSSAPGSQSGKRYVWACWVQPPGIFSGTVFSMWCAGTSASNAYTAFEFYNQQSGGGDLEFYSYNGGTSYDFRLRPTQVFRDIGWQNFIVSYDSTESSESNRIKIFHNGEEITSFAQSDYPSINHVDFPGTAVAHTIGARTGGSGGGHYKNYMTQHLFLDSQSIQAGDVSIGSLLDVFEYGTNGSQRVCKKDSDIAALATTADHNSFCLDFADSSNFGNDISGNSPSGENDFTVTSMGSANQSSNTPSLVYPTLNPLAQNSTGVTLSQGNLGVARSSSSQGLVSSTIGMTSGKYYCEVTINDEFNLVVGLIEGALLSTANRYLGQDSNTYGYDQGGSTATGGSYTSYGAAYNNGDVVGIIFDADNGKLYFSKNGTVQNSGNPVNGTNFAYQNLTNGPYFFGVSVENVSSANVFNFGQSSFAHTPPTGFAALNSANLTAPTHQGCDAFSAVTYTGNGSTRSITTDIAPAWVWIKNRSQADEHKLVDIVRGVQKELSSDDASNAEQTDSNGVTAFASSSFSLGSGANGYNDSSENFVAWCWAAGTAFSNDASATGIGTLDSSGRVNASDSLSIVTYTGSGSNASIKHGLSAAPQMYWVRDRTDGNDWNVYSADANASPASGSLRLDSAAAFNPDGTIWNGVPSSTVINLGTSDETNKLNNNFIAYCFRSVAGVCKVGSYVGNGSADGTYVSLGFKPSWILIKSATTARDWVIFDTARDTINVSDTRLDASNTGAEFAAALDVDILSDGFKLRSTDIDGNASGVTYLVLSMADYAGNGTLPPLLGR